MQCSTPYCLNETKENRSKCPKCRSREWRLKNPKLSTYQNIKSCAKARGIPFNITLEEFLAWPLLDEYIKLKGIEIYSMTIDRVRTIDDRGNIVGYTIDNMQLLPMIENVLKGHKERKQAFSKRVYCPKEPNDPF